MYLREYTEDHLYKNQRQSLCSWEIDFLLCEFSLYHVMMLQKQPYTHGENSEGTKNQSEDQIVSSLKNGMSNNCLFFLKQLNVNILAHLRRRGKETCFKSFFFFYIAQWSLQNNSHSLSETQVNARIKHKQCSHFHSTDGKKRLKGEK